MCGKNLGSVLASNGEGERQGGIGISREVRRIENIFQRNLRPNNRRFHKSPLPLLPHLDSRRIAPRNLEAAAGRRSHRPSRSRASKLLHGRFVNFVAGRCPSSEGRKSLGFCFRWLLTGSWPGKCWLPRFSRSVRFPSHFPHSQ